MLDGTTVEGREALASRYGPDTLHIKELSPGRYALYSRDYSPIAVGPWASLEALYKTRPRPQPVSATPMPTLEGFDL